MSENRYDNSLDDTSATDVLVTAGMTTSRVDAVLAPTGSISGRVTGTGGAALQGVQVDVEGAWGGWAQTDSSGAYTATGLPAGAYKVRFSSASGYLEQWYDNKPDEDSATEVQVSAGNTTININAELIEGGRITGTVTGAGGVTLQNVEVAALNPYESSVAWASTGDTGSYAIGGLPSGTYKVQFREVNGYAGEWYDNKTDLNSATGVDVTAGATRAGIDAVLEQTGRICGKVTDTDGAAIAYTEVAACTFASGSCFPVATDSSGGYTIDLPAGAYKVKFLGWGLYGAEWFDNKTSFAAATEIFVTAGNTTPGIDASLEPRGSISGP